MLGSEGRPFADAYNVFVCNMVTVGSGFFFIVQELCESRGGRPELSVLTSLLVPWT